MMMLLSGKIHLKPWWNQMFLGEIRNSSSHLRPQWRWSPGPAWRVIQVSLQWSSAMVSSKNNSNLLEQSHLHKMARRIAAQWQWCNQCSAICVVSVMILCTSTMSWRHTPETNLKHMFYDAFPKKMWYSQINPNHSPKLVYTRPFQ